MFPQHSAAPTVGMKRPFSAMGTADEASSKYYGLYTDRDPGERPHKSPASRPHSALDAPPRFYSGRVETKDAAPGSQHHSASGSRSSSHSPPSRSPYENTTLRFEPNASVVLVGMRGSGKSTLAIIASTAMKRRIIDTEKAFQEAAGFSTHAFKKTYGAAECQRRQYGVLQSILVNHGRDCIIVSSWMERCVQSLLEDFAVSHPVVHVMRESQSIASYLKVSDESKFHELLIYATTTFRACCNLEFFNISEVPPKKGDLTVVESTAVVKESGQKSPTPYMTLKRAERHFLKYLSIFMPEGSIPYVESAFPLASIPTENRQFTYAMSVPLSKLILDQLDIEDIETGVDAIEIVVDDALVRSDQDSRLTPERASQISRVVGHIRRNAVIPIIIDVIWPSEGSINETQRIIYMEHLQHALRLAPEYIAIDLRLDDRWFHRIMASKRTTKVIGTVNIRTNPPAWTDSVWTSYYRKARTLNCDIVRLLRPATQVEDNFEINSLRSALKDMGPSELPVIAFNTGSKGRNSQCFNRILTSVIPEPLLGQHEDEDSSYIPPALTALQATSALHSSFIIDAMKMYVFGANVRYSLSPAMHTVALKACGIPHTYTPYSTDSLGNIRDLIHDPHFAGASIGLPFKVEVISLTHSLSSHAKAIGAVNTLIPVRQLNPDGTIPDNALFFHYRNRAGPVLALFGENTDWIGVRACIRRGLSPANAVRPTSSGLVIGAGGMARAAVYAMLQLGVRNIAIYNRTMENATKLVSHFSRLLARHDIPLLGAGSDFETKFHVLRSTEDAWPTEFRPPTMIVSCIPTHSVGGCPPPNFTLPESWLQSPTGGVVLEYAYKYLNTPLLTQIRAEAYRGWVAMDGLDILPEQGFAQFELFTGRRAPRRLMRAEVFRSYPDEQGEANQPQLQPRLEDITEQEP
ncbi:quinate repressor [Apiospora arundinis]|uniref:Quinate repressor n=1 Tax=Apiospora arundinis TaxID=335852 RepID=A0ABR2HPR1_9PEZI